ncbi:MAG: EAL domain-containing protein [Actinobacteria bacterium]|nr:EAL domain-containing protein [Actinomycetota bacterium]
MTSAITSNSRSWRRRSALALGSATVFLAAMATTAGSAGAIAGPGKIPRQERIDVAYSRGYHDVVVPDWAVHAYFVAVGGSGAATCDDTVGGLGTKVTANYAVNPGQRIRVGVGGRGTSFYASGGDALVTAIGGWGGNGTVGGSATSQFEVGAIAGGGGGTTIDLDGTELLVAAGGGGAGLCNDGDGGSGGAHGNGHAGSGFWTAPGGAGGVLAASSDRAGVSAHKAGGGGGGVVGGGAGEPGHSELIYAGGAGGGASGTSVANGPARQVSSWTVASRLRHLLGSTECRRNEFVLRCRSMVSLADVRLDGFELLVRWAHPAWGPTGPDRLLPELEQAGVLGGLGTWTVDGSCVPTPRPWAGRRRSGCCSSTTT